MSGAPARRSVVELEARLLLEAIFETYHYDFRNYSMASLRRRLDDGRARLGCVTLSALQEKILHDPASFDALLQFLTVPVSDMFREPSFFRAFRERLVPELSTYPSLRIWVAGCSSGEEAYSFAIVLREEGLLERTMIYATDINPRALEKADSGVYGLDRIATFTQNYQGGGGTRSLSDYYTAAYGGALFDRSLRSRIVFSDHSLATDNVFAEVQVVSCRNVLIYFDRSLQERAIGLFGDAICRHGFLGLGAKETLEFSSHSMAFRPRVAAERWYQRC